MLRLPNDTADDMPVLTYDDGVMPVQGNAASEPVIAPPVTVYPMPPVAADPYAAPVPNVPPSDYVPMPPVADTPPVTFYGPPVVADSPKPAAAGIMVAGSVLDSTGHAIANALVSLTSRQTGAGYSAATNAGGTFSVVLPSGETFDVTAYADGYAFDSIYFDPNGFSGEIRLTGVAVKPPVTGPTGPPIRIVPSSGRGVAAPASVASMPIDGGGVSAELPVSYSTPVPQDYPANAAPVYDDFLLPPVSTTPVAVQNDLQAGGDPSDGYSAAAGVPVNSGGSTALLGPPVTADDNNGDASGHAGDGGPDGVLTPDNTGTVQTLGGGTQTGTGTTTTTTGGTSATDTAADGGILAGLHLPQLSPLAWLAIGGAALLLIGGMGDDKKGRY